MEASTGAGAEVCGGPAGPGVPQGHGAQGYGLLVGPWQYQSAVWETGWVVPRYSTHPARTQPGTARRAHPGPTPSRGPLTTCTYDRFEGHQGDPRGE